MKNTKTKTIGKLRASRWLGILAGLLYCSWPLGYYLNPSVSAHGLASELGAMGQPYDWVFNGGDIASGVLVLLVTALLWVGLKQARKERWVWATILNLGLFGLLTALDAVLPMQCTPSTRLCPSVGNDPLLIIHGVVSISAAVCLAITAILLWQANRRRPMAGMMLVIILGWVAFGVLSVVFFFVRGPGYDVQHYFITLCSVWLALLPVVLLESLRSHHLLPVKILKQI